MPAPHPPEFRQRAVEPARQGGKPISLIAKSPGIGESCLRNRMAQADADEGGGPGRLATAERKEPARLRRKTRQPEMENEILKRAAVYFARESVLPK